MSREAISVLLAGAFACVLGCESKSDPASSAGPPKLESVTSTAAQLCEHTRKMIGQGHGSSMSDAEFAEIKDDCIADFEKKRAAWGDALYETFLDCALRAQDMRTMVECNTVAERRAGLPIAEPAAADASGPKPGGQRLYESLLESEVPALVAPVAGIVWHATPEEISTKLPEVQRRIYRPSVHLLEAQWREDFSGQAHLVAWRAWLPAETKPDALVKNWGAPRMAEDGEGTHSIWCAPLSPEATVACAQFTQPRPGAKTRDGAQAPQLPYLRLTLATPLEGWYARAEAQKSLHDLLDAPTLDKAIGRGGRYLSHEAGKYFYEQVRDAGDLRDAPWELIIDNDRVVALELAPTGERDPTYPERMRKLAKQEWAHGLKAEWTAERTLRVSLGAALE